MALHRKGLRFPPFFVEAKERIRLPDPPPRVRDKVEKPTSEMAVNRSPSTNHALVAGFPV